MRDLTVDPIDPEQVSRIEDSIAEHDFWGGVVVAQVNGHYHVLAGHIRTEAARRRGIKTMDAVVLRNPDPTTMIRIYAAENATQRGNSGTAIAGTIAAAIKFIAKALMTGNLSGFPERSKRGIEVTLGQFQTERGIGEPIITELLDGIPGINKNGVLQQLAILKASGDYARIIGEVTAGIEKEHKEAIKAMKEAEEERILAEAAAKKAEENRKKAAALAKAAKEVADRKRAEAERQRAEAEAKLAEKRRMEAEKEAAKFAAMKKTVTTMTAASEAAGNPKDRSFDFEGVAKHLTTASHIDRFRKEVTKEGIAEILPVSQQARLAANLVTTAKKLDVELSASFITEHIFEVAHGAQVGQRRIDKEEAEALRSRDWESKMRSYMADFARNARGLLSAVIDIRDHDKKRPRGLSFHATGEFTEATRRIKQVAEVIQKLNY
jgi:hypothetical protein